MAVPVALPPSGSTGASASTRPPVARSSAAARAARRRARPSASRIAASAPAAAGRSTSGRRPPARAARRAGACGSTSGRRLERRRAPTRRARAVAGRVTTGRRRSTSAGERGVLRQLGLEALALAGAELVQEIIRQPLARAHALRSSASIRSRSRSRPWTMRIFTVPSGIPVASAISRCSRRRRSDGAARRPPRREAAPAGGRDATARAARPAPPPDPPLASSSASEPVGIARLGHAPAQLVDGARARDRHHPGERRGALRVVGAAALPGLEEDLLEDVLGRPAVAERAHEEAHDRAAAGSVQRGDRRRVAPAQAGGEAPVVAERSGR